MNGAYDGHAVQSVALPPLHVLQLLSQTRQTLSASAYVLDGQLAKQLVPCRYGLLDAHVTQSVAPPPTQVVQSE